MKKILIGGIGNILLGDDGVGPYVARLLEAHFDFEDGVEVADLGTPALDLIDKLTAKDAVILIDSVTTECTEADAGAVVLYRKADIMRHRPAVRMDPHSPALVDALLSAELFGVAPADVLLVGIAGASYEAGCSLSKPVKASLEEAIAEVLNELDYLGVGYQWRKPPAELDIWWENFGVEHKTEHNNCRQWADGPPCRKEMTLAPQA
jgi:hydrogenase maturation protease